MGFRDKLRTIFLELPPEDRCPPEVIEENKWQVVDHLAKGELSDRFQSNALLKKGEYLIFDIPGVTLAEERTTRSGSRGAYGGLSIRVMKGFWIRPGVFKTTGKTTTQVTAIDKGSFALTNKRIVFTGDRQTRNFSLSTINALVPTEHGIGINRGRKTKTEYYLGVNNVVLGMELEPKEGDEWDAFTTEFKLEGIHVQQIIQRLVQGS